MNHFFFFFFLMTKSMRRETFAGTVWAARFLNSGPLSLRAFAGHLRFLLRAFVRAVMLQMLTDGARQTSTRPGRAGCLLLSGTAWRTSRWHRKSTLSHTNEVGDDNLKRWIFLVAQCRRPPCATKSGIVEVQLLQKDVT